MPGVLLMANGNDWYHQRHIVAPAFMGDKLKSYAGYMVESTKQMLQSLQNQIKLGQTEFEIDEYMTRLTADIISRTEFDSSYEMGKQIFHLLTGNKVIENGGGEIINGDYTEQKRLRGGHDTTALLLTWTVMLLASNPSWQDKVRAEIKQVCNGTSPSIDHLSKLTLLNMVINESLRLYPPAHVLPRMAFEDYKLGDLDIPKGLSIWIPVLVIHHSEEIWGKDVNEFNPERELL
ncbi:hypothetical protein POM88_002076 [Heracleum sosnowskyi]|uniref:Cytochrome P450 n=1 Tax=Heracleum sosnowskyi TaxID=360622 RepID=A0AAD8JEZ1_9APIA|nr:hypothetical protein POM88_002076 [Heracleum sosnowskyi]